MKALNAYEFERHAGAKTKHPNNHIYFENGKTIYAVVQELKNTPQDMLFDAIQNVTGSTINQKNFRIWKGNKNCQFAWSCLCFSYSCLDIKKISYPIAQRLFAMRRYGGGMLYAALPLHMQRGCFRIRIHDQQVTKAQLYRCTRARPQRYQI